MELAELDAIETERAIGVRVSIMGREVLGVVTAVQVTPGGRSYVVEWMDGFQPCSCQFWGFQLTVIDG
jgi:hypothetical protein